MKEHSKHPTKSELTKKPKLIENQFNNVDHQVLPTVTREKGGRIRWKLPENTPEQNEQLGIRNVQALFLENFPEFNELFPRNQGGKIIDDQKDGAKRFILQNLSNIVKFKAIMGNSITIKKICPYFCGSHLTVIEKTFIPWGLEFNVINIGKKKAISVSEDNIPKDSRGTLWFQLKDNPDLLKSAIEQEAKRALTVGIRLTKRKLEDGGFISLSLAAQRHYPGGLTALREVLGVSIKRHPKNYWQNPENVEREAIEFYEIEGGLTSTLLRKDKRFDLLSAITKYPGGFKSLKNKLNLHNQNQQKYTMVPLDAQGRLNWKSFKDSPEKLLNMFHLTAQQILSEGINLTYTDLKKAGMSGFYYSVQRYYDGGFNALKEHLGIHYRTDWKDSKIIELEVLKFISNGNKLTQKNLALAGLSGLARAIYQKYPGRMRGLKEKIGLIDPNHRYDRLLDSKAIESEAKKFYTLHGKLTQKMLGEKKMSFLRRAITCHYSGGFRQLKINLGILKAKPEGYWSMEQIEKEALDFYREQGKLSYELLVRSGRSDLLGAIVKRYPGRMTVLKNKLNIESSMKPSGYWQNTENIEAEVRKYLITNNKLNTRNLQKAGLFSLCHAIGKYYPGGMFSLREKFNFIPKKIDEELLGSYESTLRDGGSVTFQEFVRSQK